MPISSVDAARELRKKERKSKNRIKRSNLFKDRKLCISDLEFMEGKWRRALQI